LANLINNSNDLGNALTSKDVYFNGNSTLLMNNFNPAALFAPSVWKEGSSISHLDDSIYVEGTSNSLMTHELAAAEAIHSPGEIGLAILEDLGWTVNRVITPTYPNNKTVVTKGTSKYVVWTDNQGGNLTIELFTKDLFGDYTVLKESIGSKMSNIGKDSIIWNVSSLFPDSVYRIKFKYSTTNYSLSSVFTINSTQQVAMPVFAPAGGTYDSGQTKTVSLSCSTTGAQIRYTMNSVNDPDSTSPLYSTPFYISANTTYKARGFKTGYSPSEPATAIFTFVKGIPIPPIVTPGGTYAGSVSVQFTGTDQTNEYIRYSTTNNGTDPCDPRLDNSECWTYWLYPPFVGGINFSYSQGNNVYKIKAVTFKNGIYSSVVSQTYTLLPTVRVYQSDSAGTSFGTWSKWENNQWKSYSDTLLARPASTENWTLKAQLDFKSGTTQKFNVWNFTLGTNYKNHGTIQINQNTDIVKAQFTHAKDATIQAQLIEGGSPGGSIQIKDPWFPDYNESPYGTRNRGDSAIFNSVNYLSNNIGTTTLYKGVFLNQRYDVPNPIYYSVNAPSPTTINGVTSYFQNWSGTNVTFQNAGTQQTGVVFTRNDAIVTANYKGQLTTNVNTSFSNPGQRKIIKTDDGILHMFYESLGYIWTERSTNGGGSWSAPQNLNLITGKSPAVCAFGNNIIVVFQINNAFVIEIYQWDDINTWYTASYTYATGLPISANCNPTIACSDNGILLLCWEYSKIKYKFFTVSPNTITEFTGTNGNGEFGAGAANVHLTPAVAKFHSGEGGFSDLFYLVWEQRNSTSSNILARKFGKRNGIIDKTYFPQQIISSGSGYTWNSSPSVIAFNDGIARINWIGQRLNPNDPDIQENVSLFNVSSGSTFYSYGNLVTSTQINHSNTGFLLAYSQNGPIYYKTNTNYYHPQIYNLNGITGQTVQVSEGLISNQYNICGLNTSVEPYQFNVGSLGFAKEQNQNIANGRTGVIVQDSVEFYFVVGDIVVDGAMVEFTSIHDTIKYETVSDLNRVLETKPFSLSNSSHFFYSIQYGTTDSLSAIAVLGESGAVNFTVELVDDQTNSIIGSYDNITFNSFTSTQYDNIAYQVNTEGIGTRMVRLRLVVNHSGLQPTYGITDRHAVESVLGKKEKQVQKILFNGTIKIDSYTLDQNYPNPFNPTTAINYTLPNPGNVLLKVYDALGKEVVTLVNSHQESGRYSVEFDASNLSSGIYLYKLTSGSYTEVKKMMLLK